MHFYTTYKEAAWPFSPICIYICLQIPRCSKQQIAIITVAFAANCLQHSMPRNTHVYIGSNSLLYRINKLLIYLQSGEHTHINMQFVSVHRQRTSKEK